MSPLEAIYFAAILLIGVPAAFRLSGRVRNPVAFVMVASWVFCRILYAITGEGMPIQAMVLSDCAVIAAMFVKEDWQPCGYETLGRQFCAIWWERTPWDRAILCLFPVVWLFYAPIVGAQLQYWVLWSISLAQLMLAGLESLTLAQGLSANKSRADAPERPPPRLFATVREGVYG